MRRRHLLYCATLIFTGIYLYSPGFDNFFYNDDFSLLGYSKYRDFGEVIANQYPPEHFDNSTTPYWRTGWYLLFKVIHSFGDIDPLSYILTGVCLHLLVTMLIYILLCRFDTPPLVSFVAGLLFLSSPTYMEAVIWPSASLNVLPAALFHLRATWAAMVFVKNGRSRLYLLCILFFLISLTFKETAYNFPVLLFAACWILDPKPVNLRKINKSLLLIAPFALAVLGHYYFLTFYKTPRLLPIEIAQNIFSNSVRYMNNIFHVDLGFTAAACIIVGSFTAVWLVTKKRTRFFFVWALVSVFPFAMFSSGSRFTYFSHIPVVLVLGTIVASALSSLSHRRAAAALVVLPLIALAVANMSLIRPEIEKHTVKGEECKRILAWIEKEGFEDGDKLHVDVAPIVLENGFQRMIDLFLDKRLDIETLHLLRYPPFAVYRNTSFTSVEPEAIVLKYAEPFLGRSDTDSDEPFERTTKAQLLQDLVTLPLFGFRYRYEVMQRKEAIEKIRLKEVDIDTTVVLNDEPSIQISEPSRGEGQILDIALATPRKMKMRISSPDPCLFMINIKANFQSGQAMAKVDGKEVRLFRANGAFHAVELPAGLHELELGL